MKFASLAAGAAIALLLAPVAARADGLCDQLGKAVGLAKTGFGPVEGDPLTAANDGQYWHSTIQLSAGDNCVIEAHRVLSCTWEPSTADDLKKMVASVTNCFPTAQQETVNADDGEPPQTNFKLDEASIEVGLTADVLSINVGP